MIISEIQLRSMIRSLLLEGSALDDRKEFDELVEAGVITSDDLALIFKNMYWKLKNRYNKVKSKSAASAILLIWVIKGIKIPTENMKKR